MPDSPLKAATFGDAFLEAILAELVTIRKVLVRVRTDVRAIREILSEGQGG